MEQEYQPRARAVTASSYASTATPPKLDERDLGLSLGGDFSDMFAGFGKRKSAMLVEEESNRAMSQSPVRKHDKRLRIKLTFEQDASPSGPATRPNRFNQPSPLNIDKNRNVEASPYSWSSQHSNDGLISSTSPSAFAPAHDSPPPPVPQHGMRSNNTSPNLNRQQRPEVGIRRSSGYTGRRKSTIEYPGEAVDEDARLLRESVSAARRLDEPSYSSKVRDSWALPSTTAYKVDDAAVASWTKPSEESTPKAKKAEPKIHEDSMFDNHITESAHLAQRFRERSLSPPTRHTPHNKVMTPAQFERYKQDQERMRSIGGKSKEQEEDDEDEDETYDDEEDEAEKRQRLAKQRRKQEAHMAVYRQQMMKVTGEAASTGIRPPAFSSQSSPNLAALGQPEEGEEEDEEVPLAILQAHGFPNKNKPPMRSAGSNPNLRAQSVAGGALPVFARALPQDPYFGAGIVHPTNRESMAFAGGAGSVNGGQSRGLPVGGLVGVIATEERSRAMRRGSPNAQGEYGPPPSNGFNGMGMPPMPRASTPGSMMNGMPGMGGMPMGSMGPVNPMMLSPGDQAQMHMSQQMQQFMQMQMHFMQMMTQGQGPPQPNSQQLGDMPRPNSAHAHAPGLRPGSSHQRAMTMMDPNAAPWMQHGGLFAPSIQGQGGYAPSIAPSERSNIGLPGRYRPVSHAPPVDNKSRASTMSGALQGWENKNSQPTVKAVKKSGNVSDEDDEEGWEEMAKKREKKKSMWRTKKDTSGFKDILNFQ